MGSILQVPRWRKNILRKKFEVCENAYFFPWFDCTLFSERVMYSNQYNSSQYGYSGGGGSVGGYQSSNYGSSGVSQLILGND